MVAPSKTRLLIPPLENGDRLSRAEFERRCEAMPHLRKAELIEGVVYRAAALRIKSHGEPHADLTGWLWTYKSEEISTVLSVLQQGLNSPEHQAFVQRLTQERG